MAQEEPAVALYDFIYRDSSRVASYYAQMFGGRLSTSEQTDHDRKEKSRSGKVSVFGSGGELGAKDEVLTSLKRTSDPHDILITDVLSRFMDQGLCHNDPASAPHGSLVLAMGTLTLVDGTILEMASVAFGAMISQEKRKPDHERNQGAIDGFETVLQFLKGTALPSLFSLQLQGDLVVAGTLKESGMEEPIPTHYFKHGSAGLAETYMVGIKEGARSATGIPSTQFFAASQSAAEALSGLVFPPKAIRVTPIAMFRKISDRI